MKIAYGAGHRLATAGKRCLKSIDPNETREWVLNDRVARHFASHAALYQGVELLRVDDPQGVKPIDLEARVKAANDWGADFCLAIHHNAGIKGGAGGGITAKVCAGVDRLTLDYRRGIYDACIAAGGLRGNRANPLGTQQLYVLTATRAPAVLVEYGFMDSTTDTPGILQDGYSELVGRATMEGIARVAGLTLAADTPAAARRVRVTTQALNIRKGPGTSYPITGQIRDMGVYTVVEEADGWGRLKSGAGWICLAYTKDL